MDAEALFQQALAHHRRGELEPAVRLYRQVLAQQPGALSAWSMLGASLKDSGDVAGAITCAQKIIALAPRLAVGPLNLGIALAEEGRLDEAVAAIERAVALESTNPAAHDALGRVLLEVGQLERARQAHLRAAALAPQDPAPQANLGNVLLASGAPELALAAYEQAAALAPDAPLIFSNILLAMNYLPHVSPQDMLLRHREWSTRFESPLGPLIGAHTNETSPDRRLRIGYHAQFFQHQPVTHFLHGTLEHHDHKHFEIVFYRDIHRRDQVTEAFDALADRVCDIANLDDAAAAQVIRNDRIDILIDLAGHMSGNRLTLFARTPAPVQVTWLGYPATTGLSAMDYRVTDAHADPPGTTESFHSERLVRLSSCWCYTPPADAPEISPRPTGAPPTFASFNTLAKVTDGMIDIWAKVLLSTPGSRMIMKAAGADDAALRSRLLDRFTSRGVAADRIDLRGRDAARERHLKSYEDVDVILDTFPYHGTTTTCEAMWMGAPVITLAGSTHVARVGVSLLNTVGLPELIASTPDEYIAIASRLARDRSRLTELRANLRPIMLRSRLCNGAAAAGEWESALRQMWRDRCALWKI